MENSGGDYTCRTVGESITKYNVPDDWCAEFDVCNGAYPIICIQVNQIYKNPAMMELRLRIIENENDEYAGCIVYPEQKTISFKVACMEDFIKAIEK